jgi:hypothetical protein
MRSPFHDLILLDAAVVLLAFAVCLPVFPADAQDWKSFSNQAFSIRYPSNWFLRDQTESRLEFVNVPGDGLNATGIKAGQTSINVFLASPAPSMDAVIAHAIDGDPVLSRKSLPMAEGACKKLEQVVTRYDGIAPAQSPIDTNLFCWTKKKTFIIRVTNWPDDKRQAEWRRVALRMAATLRPSP